MSVAQLADLLSVLPLDDKIDLLALLPKDETDRVRILLGTSEATAASLASHEYVAMAKQTTAAEALSRLRTGSADHTAVTYIYVVTEPDGVLLGVVDLRQLVLSGETTTLEELMVAPPVTVDSELVKEDIVDQFAKYNFRLLPVVDTHDHMLGVIGYKDIMR